MGFFDPIGGGGNNGGGGTPFTDITLKDKVQITDADGNILTSLPLSDKGKASYSRVLTADNIGQNGLGAKFTGNGRFAGGSVDSFNTHVADANGNNATKGILQGVTQVVAGEGIYISSPNGQGVVTVSTKPLHIGPVTDDLLDVCWSKVDPTSPPDPQWPGCFIAVGKNGVTMRSRDGHNWTRLTDAVTTEFAGPPSTLNQVNAIWAANAPYGQIQYYSPTTFASTSSLYLAVGQQAAPDGDGFLKYYQVTNLQQVEINVFYSTMAFPNSDGVLWILTGSGGEIASGISIVADESADLDNDINGYAETVIEQGYTGGTIRTFEGQPSGNNTTSTNSFVVIVPQAKFTPSSGLPAPGGGILRSGRSGVATGTWTSVYTSTTQRLNGSAYGNGVFVVCGDNNVTLRSTDDGASWTQHAGAVAGATWWYMAYGNGKFLCAGWKTVNGARVGCVQYSTDDGLTWTQGSAGGAKALYGCAYSPDLNVFVAVGLEGSIISVDG